MIVIEPPSTGSGAAAFPTLRKPELARFLKQAQRALNLRGDVTLLLADDARIRELNRSFRGKNKTTDVLSFPAAENGEGVLGDLAVSIPVAAAQAAAHGHALIDELRILTLHGLLHLAGFDHETDAGEMRAREAELREQFNLPVSLIERTLAPKPKPAKPTKTLASRPKAVKTAPKPEAAKATPPRKAANPVPKPKTAKPAPTNAASRKTAKARA